MVEVPRLIILVPATNPGSDSGLAVGNFAASIDLGAPPPPPPPDAQPRRRMHKEPRSRGDWFWKSRRSVQDPGDPVVRAWHGAAERRSFQEKAPRLLGSL